MLKKPDDYIRSLKSLKAYSLTAYPNANRSKYTMKPQVLTFIILFNILFAYAQGTGSIGVKGGVSFATMTYKYQAVGFTKSYDYKAGIYTALTSEFFKGKHLSLSTDLGFVQKGMQQKIPISTVEFPEGTGEYKILKHTRIYVTLSPMMKGFYSFNKWTVYGLFGPRVDMDVTYAAVPGSSSGSKTHRFIWGLTYGAGTEYKIGKFGVLVELLGHPNITPIMDQMDADWNSDLKITGSAYILTTGLKYHLH